MHPGSLRLLARLFGEFPDVEWLTGQASHLDEAGSVVSANPAQVWTRLAFLSGDYRWIQQESTYWCRGLWERAGGRVSEERELACDFEMWVRFFRHARLFSTQGLIGAFRFHEGSRSRRRIDDYEREPARSCSRSRRACWKRASPRRAWTRPGRCPSSTSTGAP